MNKSMLIKAGLLSLVCLPAFSQETTAPASQATPPTTTQSPPTQNQSPPSIPIIVHGAAPAPSQTTAPTTATPTEATPAATSGTTPTDATPNTTTPTNQGTTNTTPTTVPMTNVTPSSSTSPTSAPSTPPLDCNYSIPATTSDVDSALVLQWGQQAAQQTFTLDPTTLDSQLNVLKACYTDQGWKSFNNALQKSGNLDAIKNENLTVSNLLDGQATITSIKNNQWKVVVPIQVVYQNSKEKIVQSLTINLTVGRKVSGDLGIMQIVAMPRQTNNNNAPATPSSNTGSADGTTQAPAANSSTTSSSPATPATNTAPGSSSGTQATP